jgi:hypothetical protein
MTVGVFDDEIATALELIKENGQVCDWHKDGVVLVDPNRPWLGGNPIEDIRHPSICFVPATDGASGFGMTKFRAGGEDVPSFSTFGLMGAVDFEPKLHDKVLRGGAPLVIVAIDELRPAEEVVLYVLSIV